MTSSFGVATEWVNSPPLTARDLEGKVVLVDFWTYSCINWLRTLPYLHAWDAKYRDQGLVTIGVHSPEFGFEHELDNVRRAAKDMGIEYPIVIDNDFAIWRAFDNHYWPALYLIDAQGRLQHQQFGEGEYETSERMIQQLLREAGSASVGNELVSVDASGIEAAADWTSLHSPETYVGYERGENFASPGGTVDNEPHEYNAPEELALNEWACAGDWTFERESAALNTAGGRIVFRFHARDLQLVMGPAKQDAPVRFQVRIDNQPPGNAHGIDVDNEGDGKVQQPRLYQLVRQRERVSEHTFEITFVDPGVRAYVFTFG